MRGQDVFAESFRLFFDPETNSGFPSSYEEAALFWASAVRDYSQQLFPQSSTTQAAADAFEAVMLARANPDIKIVIEEAFDAFVNAYYPGIVGFNNIASQTPQNIDLAEVYLTGNSGGSRSDCLDVFAFIANEFFERGLSQKSSDPYRGLLFGWSVPPGISEAGGDFSKHRVLFATERLVPSAEKALLVCRGNTVQDHESPIVVYFQPDGSIQMPDSNNGDTWYVRGIYNQVTTDSVDNNFFAEAIIQSGLSTMPVWDDTEKAIYFDGVRRPNLQNQRLVYDESRCLGAFADNFEVRAVVKPKNFLTLAEYQAETGVTGSFYRRCFLSNWNYYFGDVNNPARGSGFLVNNFFTASQGYLNALIGTKYRRADNGTPFRVSANINFRDEDFISIYSDIKQQSVFRYESGVMKIFSGINQTGSRDATENGTYEPEFIIAPLQLEPETFIGYTLINNGPFHGHIYKIESIQY